jgi:septal ring factor EnvC (AmiA/AmiB activator)
MCAKNLPEQPIVQVRELLFGAQLKDMEMRFRRQEERLLREIGEVRESLRGRLDSLESFMKSEVASLLGRLKEERDERDALLKAEQRDRHEEVKAEARERTETAAADRRDTQEAQAKELRERADADARLAAELAAANESFERRAAKLSAGIDSLEWTLRELIKKESGEINDKIDAKHNEAVNVVERSSSQIRSDMVYRTAFSTMLTEMVSSLSKPWNIDISPVEEGDLYEAESRSEENGDGGDGGWRGDQGDQGDRNGGY